MTVAVSRFAVGQRTFTVALAVAVVVSTVLALLPVPVVVRSVVVFPVLVIVAGFAAARLVLGRDSGNGQGLVRVVLPGLLGMVSLLVVVLLLAVFRIPLGTPGVAVGAGVAALVLLLIARGPGSEGSPVQVGAVLRRLAGPGIAVLVLAGAVAGAVGFRPVDTPRYVQLALAGSGEPVMARTNSQVSLRWVLRGYGAGLPSAPPVVGVRVGGAPAARLTSTVGAIETHAGQGFVDERSGAVSFAAPSKAGLYDVRVNIGTGSSAELVVQLEVRA